MARKTPRKVTFLQASVPLAKTFTQPKRGKLKKNNYPHVSKFTNIDEEVTTIEGLYEAILRHAEQGHCLLKGEIQHAITKERRAGTTESETPTSVFVSDLDGLPLQSVNAFIRLLPDAFRNTSFILQHSASHGIGNKPKDNTLHAHIFHWLSSEVSPKTIKQWLVWFNLTTPDLRQNIQLSTTGASLRYPLDVTINQNDKLIYIAPPVLRGEVPTYSDEEHIKLVKRNRQTVDFDFAIPKDYNIDEEKHILINELREAEGLEPQGVTTAYYGDTRVQVIGKNEITVSGAKVGSEFTHCNIDRNGHKGDSWGYWHLTADPWFMKNFKDELPIIIKDADPTYYERALKEARSRLPEEETKPQATPPKKLPAAQKKKTKKWGGVAPETEPEDVPRGTSSQCDEESHECEAPGTPFTFMDKRNGRYHWGYTLENGNIECHGPGSKDAAQNFRKLNGMDTRPPYEMWDFVFDPHQTDSFRISSGTINMYQMPDHIRMARKLKAKATLEYLEKHCPLTYRIMLSATGDRESLEWALNWWACVIQKRNKTTTALVLQGTYGTGKGLLVELLTWLIGKNHVCRADIEKLATTEYNGEFEKALLAIFDEADMDSVWKARKGRSHKKVKELISESTLSYRRMNTDYYTAPNYTNTMFLANEKHTAYIGQGDRRYTVCTRQDIPLRITDKEYELFREEWPLMADFFMSFDCDEAMARTPLDNAARRFVQDLSMDSNTQIFEAIIQGNFTFFVENWPEHELKQEGVKANSHRSDLLTYRAAMVEVYENHRTGRLSRTAIESLVWHLTGTVQPTPHKAKKWLDHHGMPTGVMRLKTGSRIAYEVKHWTITQAHHAFMEQHVPKETRYSAMEQQKKDELEKSTRRH